MIFLNKISLKRVSNLDYDFLYELLQQRHSNENISHKKLPDYRDHVKFVKSNPYSKWYIIMDQNSKLGSIYLSCQNEIGIFIDKKVRHKGIGHKVIQLLIEKNPKKRYLANINPKNKKSIKFFKKHKFNLIQYTYVLIPTETNC